MNKYLFLFICFLFSLPKLSGQSSFEFDPGVKKDKIKFELVNNLIIIPVELNGLQLSFLLDTGVNTTVLFDLKDQDYLDFPNAEKVKLTGIGNDTYIEALKSEHNQMRVGNTVAKNLTLFLVLGRDINFSPRLGFPVHGILGGDFFKDFIVEINYKREFLRLYPPGSPPRKIRRYDRVPLVFFKNKPYVNTLLETDNRDSIQSTLLIDSGMADAIWLFENGKNIRIPEPSYPDFLGLGFLGDIFGQRSRLSRLDISGYQFEEVLASYPDTTTFGGLQLYVQRNGSVGGEILRRFHLIFDYGERSLFLRKNNDFNDNFPVNMSGIAVEHSGYVIVGSFARVPNFTTGLGRDGEWLVAETTKASKTFQLKPEYRIARLRKDSPAEKAGLQIGDMLVSINGRSAYKLDMEDIARLFGEKHGNRIKLTIERDGREMDFVFHLKRPL